MLFKQQKQNGDLTTKYWRFILYNGVISQVLSITKNGDYPELSQIMRLNHQKMWILTSIRWSKIGMKYSNLGDFTNKTWEQTGTKGWVINPRIEGTPTWLGNPKKSVHDMHALNHR